MRPDAFSPLPPMLILCGGLGTRLQPVLRDRPKPMALVDGVPFLEHLLASFRRQGVTRFILAAGHFGTQIQSHFQAIADVEVHIEPRPLGTAGSIHFAARGMLESELLVCNGDSFCAVDLPALCRDARRRNALGLMAVVRVDRRDELGTVSFDADRTVLEFVEKQPASLVPGWANAGVYYLSREFLSLLPHEGSLERDVFPSLISSRRLYVAPTESPLLDIGTPSRLAQAAAMLKSILDLENIPMKDVDLYRRVYLIRRAEEAICERYFQDEMKTPVHLSIGEEAICAGVCAALLPDDQLVGTYRSHGIYLARTGETDRFFGELYGRMTGIAKGKAGSMHLSAPAAGFLGSTAVVGTNIPMGVGAALANKMKRGRQVVAIFFGDGAVDEGAFWESLNFASHQRLRCLFVCEDNGLAIHSPAHTRHAYERLADVVREFNIDVYESESTIASDIHDLTLHALEGIRETGRPALLHLKYYRYREHVGPMEDFGFGYRDRAEYETWLARDPVTLQRRKAVDRVGEYAVASLEHEVDAQLLASIQNAESAPLPSREELYTDVMP